MRLDAQVLVVAKSAFAAKLVCQLFPFLEMSTLPIVARVLVTFCLDSCKAFYVALPLKVVWKPHLVQNVGSQAADQSWIHGAWSSPVAIASLATSLFLVPTAGHDL